MNEKCLSVEALDEIVQQFVVHDDITDQWLVDSSRIRPMLEAIQHYTIKQNGDELLKQENQSLKEQLKIMMAMVQGNFDEDELKASLGHCDFAEYIEGVNNQQNAELTRKLEAAHKALDAIHPEDADEIDVADWLALKAALED